MSEKTNKKLLKEIPLNIRTNIDGDIKPGIGHKVFEFNKKTFKICRIVFKREKDTYFDHLFLKWFGYKKPYPNSYFFTALNMKNAVALVQKKYNVPFVIELMEGDDE